MRPSGKARPKPPIEYSILYTATLCLIAAGAVMVYSSSSAESLLEEAAFRIGHAVDTNVRAWILLLANCHMNNSRRE